MWQAMYLWPALFDITLLIRQSIHNYVYLLTMWFEPLMLNLRVDRSCTKLFCWRLLRGTSGKSIESCRTIHVNKAWLLCLGSSRAGLLGKGAFIYGAHLIDEVKGWKGSTFLHWQPGLYLALPGLFEISFVTLSFSVPCCMDWFTAPRHDLRDSRLWRHPEDSQLHRLHDRSHQVLCSSTEDLKFHLS